MDLGFHYDFIRIPLWFQWDSIVIPLGSNMILGLPLRFKCLHLVSITHLLLFNCTSNTVRMSDIKTMPYLELDAFCRWEHWRSLRWTSLYYFYNLGPIIFVLFSLFVFVSYFFLTIDKRLKGEISNLIETKTAWRTVAVSFIRQKMVRFQTKLLENTLCSNGNF